MITDTNWGQLEVVWHRELGWVIIVSEYSYDWPIIEETGVDGGKYPR